MKRLIETLILKSHQEEVHKIEIFAERIAEEYNIGNTYFANILVSLNEAFNNALVHGNKLDQNKKIRLDFYINSNQMIFSISDQGFGFNSDIFKDDSKLGRGLMMIKHASDSVQFSDGGRCIEMLFNTASFNEEWASKRSAAFANSKNEVNKKVK